MSTSVFLQIAIAISYCFVIAYFFIFCYNKPLNKDTKKRLIQIIIFLLFFSVSGLICLYCNMSVDTSCTGVL